MADPNSQPARQQPSSYSSPHSYPSPSMQHTYTYPPPQGQPANEPYRGSPQGASVPLPSLNLPPIRQMQDGQQQSPQPPPGQQPMGSPLPPPPPHGMPPQYYGHPHAAHPPHGQPMPMGTAPHMQMRYQLPPQPADQRLMSGGRHKKEIKRRTKTGCLTCRKRRIKCDEAHPTCRNCQKSKRECMGYDPIFKQQPGPPQIQPAPNSAPPHQQPPAAPASSAPPATASYAAQQVPQGYAPATSAGYAPPSSAAGAGAAHHPPPPPPPAHDNFASAIDPQLAATDPAMHSYNGVHALNPGMGSASPYSSAASDAPPLMRARRLQPSDIFNIGNHVPPEVPPRPAPIPKETDDEFLKIFANDYCAGLDMLLETSWYSQNNNALSRIFASQRLHEEAAFFVDTVIAQDKNSSKELSHVFSQETRLIWNMLGVCKQPSPVANGTNGAGPANAENEDIALKEARARLDILQALLTNQVLEPNPLRQISYPPLPEEKRYQVEFWEELGNFVQHCDNDHSPPGAADQALVRMRHVLLAHEVRDVCYSIAIARHIGNRIRGFPNALPAVQDHNPESDINKLTVAMSFLSQECRSTSQQVLARICDMAMLSWAVGRRR